MVDCPTWNILPSCFWFIVPANPLILMTEVSLNLDCGRVLPRAVTFLPFAIMSCVFSLAVPRNKWSGRTHFLVSHLCRTHLSCGMGPLCRIHEALCAAISFSRKKNPYPCCLFEAPVHNQQPSLFDTLLQNLCISKVYRNPV
jgi:hypothetical protein